MVEILFGIYLIVVVISFGVSYRQRKSLSKADRWISRLLLFTLIFEVCSEIASIVLRNNMYVYHIWSPIELFLISFYFNERVTVLRRFHAGLVISLTGIVVAIINVIFWQPFDSLNSIFLLYEGFAIIGLCLFAFYELVQREEEVTSNVHFWITTILLIYWSMVFVYWGMYYFLKTTLREYMAVSTYVVMIANILAYSGLAIVFRNYKKMNTANG